MKTPLLLTLIILLLFNYNYRAQDSTAFKKGTIVITAGIGVPDYYRTNLRTAYRGHSSLDVYGFGPLIIKGDYGIVKFKWGHTLGAGIVLGYSSSIVKYSDLRTSYAIPVNYQAKDIFRTITIGGRGSYHFYTKKNLDCYINIGLGININTISQTATNGYESTAYLKSPAAVRSLSYSAFTAGARYYFTDNIGVYVEAGWDMSSLIQGGIVVKFK